MLDKNKIQSTEPHYCLSI